ncbi:MoxR family ATPase [Kovacikia minuta CCNUW1]|uniref:AAA family ATPase n=1 Tax=Kovacikia minuta TaxID=2931930 RepID=UPI001CCE130C|nr:MoxR family ATPase [Kovacikia minuta]UBF27482.1 MoxR family ATPase [Kovacikia minuta CCNUW1]
MNSTKQYTFRGDLSLRPKKPHKDSPQKAEPYIANEELIQAVNLAIYLRRPLLLEGEAGCGKTRLAAAVAHELGLPFYRWDVRSTSKAREGLYEYDAILRLHDVQARETGTSLNRDPANPKDYRKFGALGKAFGLKDVPAVVLIDEIDKADLDFPNDLLAVLDEPWEFEIPETGETGEAKIRASHRPIVIITSNKEKGNLPFPFLRRCIYYFLKFPDSSERLREIVTAHYSHQTETPHPSEKLVEAAANRFLEIRRTGGLFKIPGTSEFLDWVDALQNFGAKPYAVSKLKSPQAVPYRELLFKLRADWQKHASAS